MDMVSTTGVEVMTEVVTEAAVGEARTCFLPCHLDLRLKFQVSRGAWNPGLLCRKLSSAMLLIVSTWAENVLDRAAASLPLALGPGRNLARLGVAASSSSQFSSAAMKCKYLLIAQNTFCANGTWQTSHVEGTTGRSRPLATKPMTPSSSRRLWTMCRSSVAQF